MGLFDSRNPEEVGYVRYVGWVDEEKPESTGPNEDGDRVLTSQDMRSHSRAKSVTGPSGHQYRFRGQLGGASQWLPVRSRDDLRTFEDADEYETRRD